MKKAATAVLLAYVTLLSACSGKGNKDAEIQLPIYARKPSAMR